MGLLYTKKGKNAIVFRKIFIKIMLESFCGGGFSRKKLFVRGVLLKLLKNHQFFPESLDFSLQIEYNGNAKNII